MTLSLCRRLARTGMRTNRRLYIPYLLTCAGMIAMTYLISALSSSAVLGAMSGGDVMQSCLELGFGVVTFFSAIFLFYTHSFLIRRRKKEFGLYNVLGMGKRHIALVLLWESLLSALISFAGGFLGGILLSGLGERCMAALLGGTADDAMTVSTGSLAQTFLVFLVIFALILLDSLRQIRLTNPIGLMRSEAAGEKPPRANWFLAAAGLLLLGAAYWLAVTITNPLAALQTFFLAVLLVIAGTYLVFVSVSVAVCRALQKNRRYYYRTNHFVSVSSMLFRMKRNGAGLASICILCTMVLVMISTTLCLYIGAEDSLHARYPRSINLTAQAGSLSALDGDWKEEVRELAERVTREAGDEQIKPIDYRAMLFIGFVRDGRLLSDPAAVDGLGESAEDVWQVYVIPIEDYNRLMGTKIELAGNEVLLYSTRESYAGGDTIAFGDGPAYAVAGCADGFVDNGADATQLLPSLYVFVPDLAPVNETFLEAEAGQWLDYVWTYAFDLAAGDGEQRALQASLEDGLAGLDTEESGVLWIRCDGLAEQRMGFYAMYGSLLFLGVLLGVVFVVAAILIIYYKQLSEGYEDQSRFDVMQKVGMTKREIRRSINSQVLTVFFLPLLLAGVHLAFAFPMLQKLLLLFGLMNVPLLIVVTLVCYAMFAVFYLAIYRLTSRAYCRIVSGAGEEV